MQRLKGMYSRLCERVPAWRRCNEERARGGGRGQRVADIEQSVGATSRRGRQARDKAAGRHLLQRKVSFCARALLERV